MAGTQTKAISLILLFLFLFLFIDLSIGQVLGAAQHMNHAKPLKANIAQMKKRMMRKVVEIDVRLDYEGEKANPKHEPPKRPGGGNR